jgi:hypothetical protein
MGRFRRASIILVLLLSGCALDRRNQSVAHERPWPPLFASATVAGVEKVQHVSGQDWFQELPETVNVDDVTGLRLLSASPLYDVLNDEQMVYLSQFSALEGLSIMNGSITDAGIRYVAECKNLRRVYLEGLQITNAGLMHFKDTPQLEWLGINTGSVTSDGIKALREARPNLEIERGGPF